MAVYRIEVKKRVRYHQWSNAYIVVTSADEGIRGAARPFSALKGYKRSQRLTHGIRVISHNAVQIGQETVAEIIKSLIMRP